eukprot:6214534-Pleurochrysis_carterae.AAC.1
MAARLADGKTGRTDGRGKHVHKNKADGGNVRLCHEEYAWVHLQKVTRAGLGLACSDNCPFGKMCHMHFSPAILKAAHERVYGMYTTRDANGKYDCQFKAGDTQRQWRQLILSFVSFSADGTDSKNERFLVESMGPVCEGFCRQAYGIHEITWNRYLADARAGRLSAQHELKRDTAMTKALNDFESQSKFECVQWWVMWLRLEDQMPNEPVIVHRAVVWTAVYTEEYEPDIKWWGSSPSLSRERWTQLRNNGLSQLSLEYYGEVATATSTEGMTLEKQRMRREGGGHGVPVRLLSLRPRAKHSNFAQCDVCANARAAWLQYRSAKDRSKFGDVNEVKARLLRHVESVRKERQVAMDLHLLAAGRDDWQF